MILHGESIAGDSPITADIVVVGSGAAGIPLALSMADAGLDVVLIEAGREKPDAAVQDAYAGEVVRPELHQPADTYRVRGLGGSTATWGGRCVPLDNIDFEKRGYVPNSGWPISRSELDEYYPAANEWLEAGEFRYRSDEALDDSIPPMIARLQSDRVRQDSLERFSRPSNLYLRYRRRIELCDNLRLIYDAGCTNVCLEPDGQSVRALEFTTNSKQTFEARASAYVLAAGGIENARLLLTSNDVQPGGVGNDNDNVGRYYMCHIAGNVGHLELEGTTSDVRHGYELSASGVYCRRRLSLEEDEQLANKVNNVVARLHIPRISDPAHRSGILSTIYLLKPFISYEYGTRLRDGNPVTWKSTMMHVRNVLLSPLETVRFGLNWIARRNLASRKFPSIILENKSNTFSLEINAEQTPLRESRLYLSDAKDKLGMPRIVIDWRYSQRDIESVRNTLDILGQELESSKAGKLEYDVSKLETELLRFGAYGGHHIGTTRMGSDPATSVVDSDCRVHGVDNLFIAGSSVFPTSSQANPTLTLTALALRLAVHLGTKYGSGSRAAARIGP